MISPRTYRSAFVAAFALALFFLLITVSGRPSGMGSGILNFLLVFTSLACGFAGLGAWLYSRAGGRKTISAPYAFAVGSMFALGAGAVTLLALRTDLFMTLFALLISITLSVCLSRGAVLVLAALRGGPKTKNLVLGGALVAASLTALYYISLP